MLDMNNDNVVNHAELKVGLDRLHMPFSERDLNSIFQILDEDKSGTIQLSEFLDKLDMYEKMDPLPPLQEEVDDFRSKGGRKMVKELSDKK